MRRIRVVILTVLMILMTTVSMSAWSQDNRLYTHGELDEMLAPIALYPDPLIAQILPSCTYPDQLKEADDLIRYQGGTAIIDRQPWDVSVRAVSHYPAIVNMLVSNPDWTIAVGQAYYDQPDDVLNSIQRLRGRARLNHYLESNRYQRVYYGDHYVRIVPAEPNYIYAPVYDPEVVYVQERPNNVLLSNVISFGLGFLIGSWLNRDCDWDHHRIFYHGWRGGGWIRDSRPHVDFRSRYYVNNAFNRPVRGNPRVRSLDIGHFRSQVRANAGTYRFPGNHHPRPVAPSRIAPSGRTIGRPGGRPGAPNVRPGAPGRAGSPIARPGGRVPVLRPNARPGGPNHRSTGRTRVPTVRPSSRPGNVGPRATGRDRVPTLRPSSRPGNVGPRATGRNRVPTLRPSSRPGNVGPRATGRTRVPTIRPSARPSRNSGGSVSHGNRGPSNQGVGRNRASNRPSAPRVAPSRRSNPGHAGGGRSVSRPAPSGGGKSGGGGRQGGGGHGGGRSSSGGGHENKGHGR